MLVDSLAVTTVAVTDLEAAKHFFADQVGLRILEEAPFAIRFGAGKGSQLSVRRGPPNVGQTVAHFEVDDLDGVVADLVSRGVPFQEYETPKTVNFIAQVGPARAASARDPSPPAEFAPKPAAGRAAAGLSRGAASRRDRVGGHRAVDPVHRPVPPLRGVAGPRGRPR